MTLFLTKVKHDTNKIRPKYKLERKKDWLNLYSEQKWWLSKSQLCTIYISITKYGLILRLAYNRIRKQIPLLRSKIFQKASSLFCVRRERERERELSNFNWKWKSMNDRILTQGSLWSRNIGIYLYSVQTNKFCIKQNADCGHIQKRKKEKTSLLSQRDMIR